MHERRLKAKPMQIQSYVSPGEALGALSCRLSMMVRQKKRLPFHLALSGGGTARLLFAHWTASFRRRIDWQNIRFYWVDERCVPPSDPQSNYGEARRLLFDPLGIPPEHCLRIAGEADPGKEAGRCSEAVRGLLSPNGGPPRFDCAILGVGTDLHTASIFPHMPGLLDSEACYAVSRHPATGQRRITLTGPPILNCAALLVGVVGKEKAEVVRSLREGPWDESRPASYLLFRARNAVVFSDVF